MSVIACIRGSISYMYSENIGGVVGGELQPGGLDIEPNAGNDFVVRDFIVYSVDVINGGTGGIAMYYGGYLVKGENINGMTLAATIPTSGVWRQGDMVRNSAPATANLTYGWIRLTTGNTNIVGTDWMKVSFS